MTDMSNRKAELLANPIHHIDITEFDGRELIDSWEKMSFTSRDAARAARILQSAVADPDCSRLAGKRPYTTLHMPSTRT